MSLAIKEAWKYQGLTYPNPAVGAAISRNGLFVCVEAHKNTGEPHAEVLAIKTAYLKLHPEVEKTKKLQNLTKSDEIHAFLYENHDNIFRNCTIYTTLEPCNHYGRTPPCSLLIKNLGFKTVVFGSRDYGKDECGGAEFIKSHGISVVSEFMQNECDLLLEPFVRWKNGQFVFFKYAQTINGVIAPGKISCDKSFEIVHRLRDKIDLIVVGGNTVRSDRPALDARIISGKAPDVMIYSKNNDFDPTIPLFNVPHREVFVSDKLEIPEKYRFVMIEGGSTMLEESKKICDYYLIFLAPRIKSGVALSQVGVHLEYLNNFESGEDIAIWARRSENE